MVPTPGLKAPPGPAASAAAFSPAPPKEASAEVVVVLLLPPVPSSVLAVGPGPHAPFCPPALAEGVRLPLAAVPVPSGNARPPGRHPEGRPVIWRMQTRIWE